MATLSMQELLGISTWMTLEIMICEVCVTLTSLLTPVFRVGIVTEALCFNA